MTRRLLIALALAVVLADLWPVAARQRITADEWGLEWAPPPRGPGRRPGRRQAAGRADRRFDSKEV
jgi:hypothetical protein